MIPADWLQLARERIRPHTVRTPLTYDARNNLYLKWENHQVTGSFKPRGALNKVLSLEDWERKGGLVAASAGNHGQGVALAAGLTKTRAEVFVPVSAPSSKVEAIRALGGEVIQVNGGYGETEQAAKQHAEAHGRVFISPYNDGQVIAGQGTIALEIIEQLREQFQVDPSVITRWVFPTGGGGLISGCGEALASTGGRAALVGVQPEASAFTFNLLRGGSQAGVTDDATLAEGLSGAIDEDSITIPMMRRLIQEIVTVTEEAIARAIAHAWWTNRERIEGSAATALAAALDGIVRARPAVVVLTGGNIDTDVFERIIAQYPQQVRGMRRLVPVLVMCSMLLAGPASRAGAQGTPEPGTPAAVQDLFDVMSAEERVGQLFLVDFTGTDTSETSQIYDLLVNQHIGGVSLSAANDNFAPAPNTVSDARDLIRRLQQVEWNSSARPPSDPITGRPIPRAYVPLFVATIQDGDGAPGDQILSGLTPAPSAMAIGATWSPELARQVGEIAGNELAGVGFNMYFGPSLDVLENLNPLSANDPGVGVFGGDPFWVSLLGRAYVAGLHEGSQAHLLVIPKHFPGRGSSDRSGEQEVATVRKSFEELQQIELAPFFAVTRESTDVAGIADGLLVSHIRYQGFQGNIRATTKPVSFDAQALSIILGLPDFAAWRDAGGLIISDNLGTAAVRSFYSTGTEFTARTVARDAFVAGNDVLYLGGIQSSGAVDNYSTVLDILDFFVRKYKEDPGFAQRVDAAALRILSTKYALYGRFGLSAVLQRSAAMDATSTTTTVGFEVASRGATLLSPAPQDLTAVLQAPPQVRDRIVFFTDSSGYKQCSTCADVPGLAVDALQRAVVALYGPEAGNQTSAFRLSSYGLGAAASYSAGESPPYLAEDLASAAWVVFAISDNSQGQARLVSTFLAEQQDLLREKRVILFAFGSPTYMDATDISRLTAYYALYSKQQAFIEVAARLLFQEITPVGASPVSVAGLGYDLRSVTSPDPNQIISLALDLPTLAAPPGEPTPEATPVPLFRIGDTIGIRTGTIRDHNGHAVPDGTVVTFSMELRGEGGSILQQQEAITAQGVARVSFGLDQPGLLEIRAASDPALLSQVLQLDVGSGGQAAAVTVIAPELTESLEEASESTPVSEENDFVTRSGALRFSAWVATILLLLACCLAVGFAGWRAAGPDWGLRWGLAALAGGLLPYNYVALGLPGGPGLALRSGIGGIILLSAVGLLTGWFAAWIWWRQTSRRGAASTKDARGRNQP